LGGGGELFFFWRGEKVNEAEVDVIVEPAMHEEEGGVGIR
jgi:hypothetical protein